MERIATIISIMKGIATNRVARPSNSSTPPTISRPPTKWAVSTGSGIPNFVNRPTPWLTKTNLRMPSQRKTEPAMIRNSNVALGATFAGPATTTRAASASSLEIRFVSALIVSSFRERSRTVTRAGPPQFPRE